MRHPSRKLHRLHAELRSGTRHHRLIEPLHPIGDGRRQPPAHRCQRPQIQFLTQDRNLLGRRDANAHLSLAPRIALGKRDVEIHMQFDLANAQPFMGKQRDEIQMLATGQYGGRECHPTVVQRRADRRDNPEGDVLAQSIMDGDADRIANVDGLADTAC